MENFSPIALKLREEREVAGVTDVICKKSKQTRQKFPVKFVKN